MSEYAKLVISVDSTQAKVAEKDLGALDKSASSLSSGLSKLIVPLASVATAMAGLNKAVEVQRQFDVLNAGLITATGSSEKAAGAFKALQQFAQKTPYDLNQAVKGFTQLVNLGLTPSEKAMTSYGNTASAMGKDLSQMIEAVADATTGEFERLKEFGIKSKVNGDSIAFTFQGVTKKIGNNAAEIEKYLINLGETKFGTAMLNRMTTLDGAISNLGDNFETTFRLINQAGLGDLMRSSVNNVSDALTELNNQIASGELEGYLGAIAGKFAGFEKDVVASIDIIQQAWLDATSAESRGGIAYAGQETVQFLIDAFRNLPGNVRAFVQIMTVEVLSGFDKASAYAGAFKDGLKAIFTDDTFEGVGARLEGELSKINGVREDSIAGILAERDGSLASFKAQTDAAKDKRKVFDAAAAADAANTADRLAQFKVLGDGSKAQTAAEKKAADEAAQLAKQQAKALKDLLDQSAISVKSSNSMADAYLAGADNVRELTIQQKIEEELLKTGASARDKVTEAVNKEADAKDRLDVDKSISDLRLESTNTLAQATATLQGAAALDTFNAQKSMAIALTGKKIAVDSDEYKQLLDSTKAQLAANKALEQANSVEGIVDRLNPQVKLLRDYTTEQKALNAAIASGSGDTALYQATLAKLGLEYEQNKAAASAWGQFTQGAVDRVDEAFADAWKNIDKGFSGFASSLKDGFKQLLAELAHMAITKPIIMQIGAALGVGGLTAQSSGLLGGTGGASSIGGVFNGLSSAFSLGTSSLSKAVSTGYSSGGIPGAFSGGSDYLSGLFSSGTSAVGTGSTAAGYTGNAFSSWVGTQNALSYSVSGLTQAISGLGGAIYGYGQSGVKGAIAGGLGGWGGSLAGGAAGSAAGAALGGTLGSIVPVAGTILGAAIGSYLGGSLFGGGWVTKDQGLSLGVTDGDLSAQQFEYQKKKGGLFGSNKKRTRYSAVDSDTQAALDDTYEATTGAVFDLFDKLNVTLNDGVLDGLNVSATQISTKDKTAEQIQTEITAWFGTVADTVVSTINDAASAGLTGYNFEALTTFVNNLYGVNDIFTTLNLSLFDTSVSGGKLAESLVNVAGSLANLQTAAATYYDKFYTDTEKAAATLAAVQKQFKDMDVTLPASRDGYRRMVEGIDRTTEAGQEMFVTLTAAAGAASSAYDILEQRTQAATNSAFSALQRSITAQQKAAETAYNAHVTSLNDMASTAAKSVTDMTAVSTSLSNALKALNGTSDDAVKQLRAQAQATLQSALATARSGGSLAGFAGLDDALSTISSNNTDLYGSMEDFARDQGRTANVVAELNTLNGKQLTSAEQTSKTLQDQLDQAKAAYDAQMAQYDAELAFAQAQLDALNGVDTSVKSVADAVRAMNAAVVAALATLPRTGVGSAVANTSQNNATIIDSVYQAVLGRDTSGDAAGAAFWTNALNSGQLSYDQIAAAVANGAVSGGTTADAAAAGKYLGLPGYATGGLISGPGTGTSDSLIARLSNGEYVMNAAAVQMFGTGLLDQMNAGLIPAFATGGGVGEVGPQLEVTRPSQIYKASGAGITQGGGTDTAVLEQKVDVLIDVVKQIVGPMKINSDDNSKLMKKWDRIGLPTKTVKEGA